MFDQVSSQYLMSTSSRSELSNECLVHLDTFVEQILSCVGWLGCLRVIQISTGLWCLCSGTPRQVDRLGCGSPVATACFHIPSFMMSGALLGGSAQCVNL